MQLVYASAVGVLVACSSKSSAPVSYAFSQSPTARASGLLAPGPETAQCRRYTPRSRLLYVAAPAAIPTQHELPPTDRITDFA
jgi:hypothetical protein